MFNYFTTSEKLSFPVDLAFELDYDCVLAPEYVQSWGASDPTRGAVHSPQGRRDHPLALRPHQGGLHAGQAGDQTVWSPSFTARSQIHCEDVLPSHLCTFSQFPFPPPSSEVTFVSCPFVQIPLSGYGGTSNIILEDQRKQADGYVATLTDIAVGRVSKVCLCVRNTGSRAAFIKAVAFSDVQTRKLMEPSIISLAPSQFVLKERTQEVGERRQHNRTHAFILAVVIVLALPVLCILNVVTNYICVFLQVITVLMKSTHREQSLCQSDSTLLATVLLFCGDEVSRQQYRGWDLPTLLVYLFSCCLNSRVSSLIQSCDTGETFPD